MCTTSCPNPAPSSDNLQYPMGAQCLPTQKPHDGPQQYQTPHRGITAVQKINQKDFVINSLDM